MGAARAARAAANARLGSAAGAAPHPPRGARRARARLSQLAASFSATLCMISIRASSLKPQRPNDHSICGAAAQSRRADERRSVG
jgi:hypothetical protein